jgi:hypothetical protein
MLPHLGGTASPPLLAGLVIIFIAMVHYARPYYPAPILGPFLGCPWLDDLHNDVRLLCICLYRACSRQDALFEFLFSLQRPSASVWLLKLQALTYAQMHLSILHHAIRLRMACTRAVGRCCSADPTIQFCASHVYTQ